MASFQPDRSLTGPLGRSSGRVKTARKLARRAFRAEQGLFLAEGPRAVREALAVPGCVSEVFAVPGRHDALRARRNDGDADGPGPAELRGADVVAAEDTRRLRALAARMGVVVGGRDFTRACAGAGTW